MKKLREQRKVNDKCNFNTRANLKPAPVKTALFSSHVDKKTLLHTVTLKHKRH